MIKVKKIIAAAVAAACAGAMPLNAYAAEILYSWRATYRNLPGAPSSATSTPDVFTIHQFDKVVTARMLGATTTKGGEVTTTNTCENYEMTPVVFYDYLSGSSKPLSPDIGSPIEEIPVRYSVSAFTDIIGDTAVSTGEVIKK